VLRKSNIRMTAQRRVIFEVIKEMHSHPTADEIYHRVREQLPHISLGTVYRNLELLSNEGIIHKVETGSGQRRYDCELHDHYHIRCIHCGQVEDIPVKQVKKVQYDLTGVTDFDVLDHHLEFLGVCPACRAKQSKQEEAQKN